MRACEDELGDVGGVDAGLAGEGDLDLRLESRRVVTLRRSFSS
jgi:hypothetical protein